MKTALTIAGSDCSGGAGIQADLKTFSAHGVFGMSVITSVVAENTLGVLAIEKLSASIIEQQIKAIYDDIEVDAVKIGMLFDPTIMETVSHALKDYKPQNIVLDPVMYAKDGTPLMNEGSLHILIKAILPITSLLTPNIPEAEILTKRTITSPQDMETAALLIHQLGVKNVLVKGGHALGDAIDVFYDGKTLHHFNAARIPQKSPHGTGCTYSSAISANLALGMKMPQAISAAKEYMTTVIKHALPIGNGNTPVHHFYNLYKYGLLKGDYQNEKNYRSSNKSATY